VVLVVFVILLIIGVLVLVLVGARCDRRGRLAIGWRGGSASRCFGCGRVFGGERRGRRGGGFIGAGIGRVRWR
jgi:hypothetical protein